MWVPTSDLISHSRALVWPTLNWAGEPETSNSFLGDEEKKLEDKPQLYFAVRHLESSLRHDDVDRPRRRFPESILEFFL
ncbi:unnamed protein product [Strongylus vulgaris]|uniref:Uncharacterized protein n=1 Tax=Strongylus vulgaris TaxID=40348 RepID=A0A3P7JGV7_STRVU|nr:unnamed protein product [Strongylus vulgaris]